MKVAFVLLFASSALAQSVWFEPNAGQVAGKTQWIGRSKGAYLYLKGDEVVYANQKNVHMRLVGANAGPLAEKLEPTGGYSNYFTGRGEKTWFTGIPHYAKLRYHDVYPGIDIVYYAAGHNVEYDFAVRPGADPNKIELAFSEPVRLDQGDLIVAGLRQHKPRVLQDGVEVAAEYRLTKTGNVSIGLAAYDRSKHLNVDPVLEFSTYLGGPGEEGFGDVAIAPDGNPVLVGSTQSPAAPTLDPFQQPFVVSLAPIVLKMSADGQRIMFYSILGNGGWSGGAAVAVDRDGTIVVGGHTRSATFPLKNAFQSQFKAAYDNAFVTRLSADGRSLIHSSYLGGSYLDDVRAITLDTGGNAYVVGATASRDFPILNPIQAKYAGGNYEAYLAKIGPAGALLFSTYFGGSGLDGFNDIRWRSDGVLVIVGQSSGSDFPLKDPIQSAVTSRTGFLNPILLMIDGATEKLLYSTYIGGGAAGVASRVFLDAGGRIYIAGEVDERHFPTKNPLFGQPIEGRRNGFLIQFSSTGKSILFSTFLPGGVPVGLCVDPANNIYIGGSASESFPTKGSLQDFLGGGILNSDFFVMKLAPEGQSLMYSTLIGGIGNENGVRIACDSSGRTYFVGGTLSADFPVRSAYQSKLGGSSDGVFGRVSDTSVPELSSFSVTPSNVTFTVIQNGPSPMPVSLAVEGLTQSATVQSSDSWLSVAPGTLAASGMLQLSVDPSTLRPGVSRAVVRLTPASGVPAIVNVSVSVLSPAPLLSSVEPAGVPIGSDDTEITLRGSGFTNSTLVMLETNPWTLSPVRIVDSSTIRFQMPKAFFAAETNFSFTVKNPDSAISKAAGLSVGRPAPAVAAGGIVNAASFSGQAISPGEIISIFGENFEPGMRVLIDRISVRPLAVTANQISVTVPYAVSGSLTSELIVEASQERRSVPVRISVAAAQPGLFTANSSGQEQGAILNQDGSANSIANPAVRGSVVVLYGTGGGSLTGDELARLALPVHVLIDGIESEVLYAGVAPGLVEGMVQINVRVPENATEGKVVLRVGEAESQPGVKVALQ